MVEIAYIWEAVSGAGVFACSQDTREWNSQRDYLAFSVKNRYDGWACCRKVFQIRGLSRLWKYHVPTLHEWVKECELPKRRYKKAGDAVLSPVIQYLIDARPIFSYWRITVLVNWQRLADGLPIVNLKHVHRIMGSHQFRLMWLRNGRIHDDEIIVKGSNLAWCSDASAFTCWNVECISLALIMGCLWAPNYLVGSVN